MKNLDFFLHFFYINTTCIQPPNKKKNTEKEKDRKRDNKNYFD